MESRKERETSGREAGSACGSVAVSRGAGAWTQSLPLSHLSSCPGAWFRVLGPCLHGSPALPDCRVLESCAHFVMETHQQGGEIPEFQVLYMCVDGVGEGDRHLERHRGTGTEMRGEAEIERKRHRGRERGRE